MQKDPVQLPSLNLPSGLSERQQAESINLKPSEVRLSSSQSRSMEDQTPKPSVQVKGILKKTSSEDGGFKGEAKTTIIPTGQKLLQNGQRSDKITLVTAGEYSPAPRSTAPWRQRVRKDVSASSQRSRRPVSMTDDCLSTPQSTRDRYDFSLYSPVISGLTEWWTKDLAFSFVGCLKFREVQTNMSRGMGWQKTRHQTRCVCFALAYLSKEPIIDGRIRAAVYKEPCLSLAWTQLWCYVNVFSCVLFTDLYTICVFHLLIFSV